MKLLLVLQPLCLCFEGPIAGRASRIRVGMVNEARVWWRDGVIYQVYPRSFQDSNGDGVGDLEGIRARLGYLVELGVDAVWVSPIYPSPMADFGYDVADYTGVDPIFGTLADFDRLIAEVHARGLKLVLDFVPNHSSDKHPWFVESRTSRKSAKRDWYLWRDPAPGGGVPNNWKSNFGGAGWTLDEGTGQYYYHSFLKQQPDLNWWNPEVRAAMYAAMRFWLEKGVDGFRMDVIWMLIKDREFRDNPVNAAWDGGAGIGSVRPVYTANRPETLGIVREMRALLDEYPERVLIGEIYLPIEELVTYYGGPGLDGAQMPFNFQLILTGWEAPLIAGLIRRYEAALPAGAWPNWVMGNHDQHRIATRNGAAQARVAAVLLLTLRGTPTLYNGDELGMPDARIGAEDVRDPAEKNEPGRGLGRDPERSPMLWENRENAGFTVETEMADAGTMLKLYRALLEMRRARPALYAGSVGEVEESDGVLRYVRADGAARLQVHLNLTGEGRWSAGRAGVVVLASGLDRMGERVGNGVELRGNEAVVVEVS